MFCHHPINTQAYKQRADYGDYADTFCLSRNDYVVSHNAIKADWRLKHKQLTDYAIISHLEGRYWVGVRGPWYPRFGVIDIDQPCYETEHVERILDKLRIDTNQVVRVSSPRGRTHLLFKPQYKGKPPTMRLFREIMSDRVLPHELYPQENRYVRLPFGRSQYILDCHGMPVNTS